MPLLVWLWDSPLFWFGMLHINNHGQVQWAACQVCLLSGRWSPTSCTCRTTGGPGLRGLSSSSSSASFSPCCPSSLSSPSSLWPSHVMNLWKIPTASSCRVCGASCLWSGPLCFPCLPTATARSSLTSPSSVTFNNAWQQHTHTHHSYTRLTYNTLYVHALTLWITPHTHHTHTHGPSFLRGNKKLRGSEWEFLFGVWCEWVPHMCNGNVAWMGVDIKKAHRISYTMSFSICLTVPLSFFFLFLFLPISISYGCFLWLYFQCPL